MSTILSQGKYAGFTFEEALAKDLPYCEFLLSLKFVKPHFEEFRKFLQENINKEKHRRQVEQLTKLHRQQNAQQ